MASALVLSLLAAPTGFALVVTNNRSLEASRPDLRYADDDGVNYATLFAERLGKERVTLLTELDPETRALYRETATDAPTWAALGASIAALRAEIAAARARGEQTEVWVVMAGHGDVDRGQGYVELADRRLYASDLEAQVIEPLDADRLHLILDSCNSYFMLNPRKPGGTRWTVATQATKSLLERHPNVGAVISTSAEAVTYEWSEVQAGIFSYEVRSGLRGAADADADGAVTYEELTAFLETTNRPIENDLYRPKVFAQGPAADGRAVLLSLGGPPQRKLVIAAAGDRRVTIRDHRGVRVLDIHKESGTPVTLHLPGDGPLGLFEHVGAAASARPTVKFRSLSSTSSADLDALREEPTAIAGRGEAPVFRSIFTLPYGQAALHAHRSAPVVDDAPAYGISTKDATRLGFYLRTTAEYEREERIYGGAYGCVMSVAAVLGGGLLVEEAGEIQLGSGILFGAAGLLALTGTLGLLVPTESEDLLERYHELDFSTEVSRGEAVTSSELAMQKIADDYALGRMVIGVGAFLLSAGTFTAVAVSAANTDHRPRLVPTDAIALAAAGGLVVFGVYELALHRFPAERTWDLYKQELELDGNERLLDSVTPAIGPTEDGGFSLGVVGKF